MGCREEGGEGIEMVGGGGICWCGETMYAQVHRKECLV